MREPSPFALTFGKALAKAWKQESSAVPYREPLLFRAFRAAILSLSNQFLIEEFHGNKHQVAFVGRGSWCRKLPRCEISDLLILTFRERPSISVRMTFLQIKRAGNLQSLCHEYPNFRTPRIFSANLEQWDLLSRRPSILGIPPFDPPAHLLRGALLPSVGSYGVFHKVDKKAVGFLYSSAHMLRPVGKPNSKHWRLMTRACNHQIRRILSGYTETVMTCCLAYFGAHLFDGTIGTPIDLVNVTSTADRLWRMETRTWLANVLSSLIRTTDARLPGTKGLINLFESPIVDDGAFSSPCPIIVINTEERREG